jgi:hypothetical protein
MKPAQAKPVRRRRRWLIVAPTLVLVSVGWWYWPRGDARFVGKWAVTEVRNGQTAEVGFLTLRGNGGLDWKINQPSLFRPIRWEVQNDWLQIRDFVTVWPKPVQDFMRWANTSVLSRTQSLGGSFDGHIRSIGENVIELELSLYNRVVLSRIPE